MISERDRMRREDSGGMIKVQGLRVAHQINEW